MNLPVLRPASAVLTLLAVISTTVIAQSGPPMSDEGQSLSVISDSPPFETLGLIANGQETSDYSNSIVDELPPATLDVPARNAPARRSSPTPPNPQATPYRPRSLTPRRQFEHQPLPRNRSPYEPFGVNEPGIADGNHSGCSHDHSEPNRPDTDFSNRQRSHEQRSPFFATSPPPGRTQTSLDECPYQYRSRLASPYQSPHGVGTVAGSISRPYDRRPNTQSPRLSDADRDCPFEAYRRQRMLTPYRGSALEAFPNSCPECQAHRYRD